METADKTPQRNEKVKENEETAFRLKPGNSMITVKFLCCIRKADKHRLLKQATGSSKWVFEG